MNFTFCVMLTPLCVGLVLLWCHLEVVSKMKLKTISGAYVHTSSCFLIPPWVNLFTTLLTSFLFLCRLYPAVLQFSVFLLVYMLLLLLALAEEFRCTPSPLQQFCCWIHENNSARNLLTLTAIVINFGLVSADMVRV